MFQPVRRAISSKMPVFSPDEYRILASVGCATLYFGFMKPEVAGLISAAVALILLVYQGLKAVHFLGRPNIFVAIGVVLSFFWVLSASLPAHALLDEVQMAIETVLGVPDMPEADDALANGIDNFFTILDLFIIFVLIGSVAFAIYQGSQSNDIRPILFAIAFIVGGIMVLEIGSSLILSSASDDGT